MTKLLLRWILLAISVVAASYVCQALGLGFEVDVKDASSFIKLLLGVAVLAFLNATVGKLIKFLTLPLSCITLGLFSLVIHAAILMAGAALQWGFQTTKGGSEGLTAAFGASL